MDRVRAAGAWLGARPGPAAILCLGFAWAFAMHGLGWTQLAHFAQVRAFSEGIAEIDRWHWETNDKAWVDGHFYSVKAPGVAALSTPPYMAIDALGGADLARDAAQNARETDWPRWGADPASSGADPAAVPVAEGSVESNAPIIWALTLVAAVIPSVLLLFCVRWAADRIEPGYGTAAAVTLGLASILMIFAAEYFSHAISAALGFAAFAVLMRERAGAPDLWAVGGAGVLAGLAVSFEYQVGLVGVIVIFYALAREAPRLPRAGAYAAGAVAGALPALAFNAWALGSPFDFAYSSAVEFPGESGHEVLGLNSDGFFGITAPRLEAAVDLLVSNRGLLVLTPVIAAALAGAILMRRGTWRPEANVILAIAAVYFLYNAGYWLTFGGGSPGPRFLIPALPFLALGWAVAYRRFGAITLALAVPSALIMVAASITFPLLQEPRPGTWLEYFQDGRLEHTVLTIAGVSNVWVSTAPILLAVAAAVALAFAATPARPLGPLWPAVASVAAWVPLGLLGPEIAGNELTPLGGDPELLHLLAFGAALSLAVLAAISLREGRRPSGSAPRAGLSDRGARGG